MSEEDVAAIEQSTPRQSSPASRQPPAGTVASNLVVRSDTRDDQPEHAHHVDAGVAYMHEAQSDHSLPQFTGPGDGMDHRASANGLQSHPSYEAQGYAPSRAAMHWQGEPAFDPRLGASGSVVRGTAHMTPPYNLQQPLPGYDDPRNRAFRDQGYMHHAAPSYGPQFNAYQYGQTAMQPALQSLPMRPHVGYMPQQHSSSRHISQFAQSPAYEGMMQSLGPYNPAYYQAASSAGPPAASSRGQVPPTPLPRTPSYPRGPPRKPKQSGFAVWVGNLSPGTTIEQLKDFFARGATSHIESVFLISKSNCAFVNYKSPESAQAAVARFHDSRLNGVRLVCRLRHGQSQSITESASPSSTKNTRETRAKDDSAAYSVPEAKDEIVVNAAVQAKEGSVSIELSRETKESGQNRMLEKFFVVKSLTLQDLEASVRDGIWATQAHNEAALNEAFAAAQTVYLIFSANKSGEYFGYARMLTAIDSDSTEVTKRAEKPLAETSETPTSTPTPATDTAPPGRIVDDSARGTIFWEADTSSDSEGDADERTQKAGSKAAAQARRAKLMEEAEKQDWGKPFKIEWVSTTRLPFFRTRGLRNPWNANREIKIARDGTELEPSVGRRLLDMFHENSMQSGAGVTVSYQAHQLGPAIAVGSHVSGLDAFQSQQPGQ